MYRMSDKAEFELCRLCLNSRGLLMNVFGENSKLRIMLETTIEDLIDVKVVRDENYPWFVCSNCMEKLTEFRLFKRRCAECLSVFYNRIQQRYNLASKDRITNGEEFSTEIKKENDDDKIASDTVDNSTADIQDDMIIVKEEVGAANGFFTSPLRDVDSSKIPSVQEGCSHWSDNEGEENSDSLTDEELCLSINDEVVNKEEENIDVPQEEGDPGGDALQLQDGGHVQDGADDGDERNLQHICQICNQVFVDSDVLEAHRMHDHFEEEKQLICDFCSKIFKYKKNLNKHVESVHAIGKEHQCQHCSRYFKNLSQLKVHLTSHTDEKPIKCKICSKGFAQSGYLRRHMWTHSNEKRHKCGICSKGFNQSGNLKKHILIHTGEKPFECEICSRSFSQKGSVKVHMLTHTGEMPFKCDICSKGFRSTSRLKNHVLAHTSEKPHKCQVCSKGFRLKQHLMYHMSMHGRFPYRRVVKRLYIKKHGP